MSPPTRETMCKPGGIWMLTDSCLLALNGKEPVGRLDVERQQARREPGGL
jgi:hypothetical protein